GYWWVICFHGPLCSYQPSGSPSKLRRAAERQLERRRESGFRCCTSSGLLRLCSSTRCPKAKRTSTSCRLIRLPQRCLGVSSIISCHAQFLLRLANSAG